MFENMQREGGGGRDGEREGGRERCTERQRHKEGEGERKRQRQRGGGGGDTHTLETDRERKRERERGTQRCINVCHTLFQIAKSLLIHKGGAHLS